MYKPKFFNKEIDLLLEVLLQLKTKDELMHFLEDVCTIKEITDMGQRLTVAKLLHEKMPYQQIVKDTKASTATIARVNKSLVYGSDGYYIAFKKLKKDKS